jgi:putative transcriptional regulator
MTDIIARIRKSDGQLVRVHNDGREEVMVRQPMREMTDEEIMAAALSDPDAQPLTDEQFSRLKTVPRAKTLRRRLGLSQEEFAATYHVPVGTLRDWEQGRTEPDQPARAYLHVIAADPEGVARTLRELPARPTRAAE